MLERMWIDSNKNDISSKITTPSSLYFVYQWSNTEYTQNYLIRILVETGEIFETMKQTVAIDRWKAESLLNSQNALPIDSL